jgi:hypothetical protein
VTRSSIAGTGHSGRLKGNGCTFRISACTISWARRCASATAAVTRSDRNSASLSAKRYRVDHDRVDGPAAVRRHFDQPGTGTRFDGPGGQLGLELLQSALHLLPELKELLKICHYLVSSSVAYN